MTAYLLLSKRDTFIIFRSISSGKKREKRPTNQLKIAHITDVHVEFEYVPVG